MGSKLPFCIIQPECTGGPSSGSPSNYLQPWGRSCTDLYLDPGGAIWVAAVEDSSDAGPFRSIIYRYGHLNSESWGRDDYFMPSGYMESWVIEGVKIEALAAPCIPGSAMSYATDDENYGGVWRPLGLSSPSYLY